MEQHIATNHGEIGKDFFEAFQRGPSINEHVFGDLVELGKAEAIVLVQCVRVQIEDV